MVSVEEACVGRAQEGLHFQNVVRAPDVVRGPDVRFWSVEVCLRVPGLEASSRVSAHYASEFDDLVAFFRQLAADWRGWGGERIYESLEHDLRLTATHDGHVRLAVQLWQEPRWLPGWSAAAVITLEPGEEMTRVAEDVAALLSSRP
jgi:hypothetical protein